MFPRAALGAKRLGLLLLATTYLASISVRAQDAEQRAQALPADLSTKIDAGDFAAAEAELRALLKAEPRLSRAQFALGYVLSREGRLADSLAAYTAGARSDTPSSADLLVVASDYIQLRSYPDAVRWLSYVTEHDPQSLRAWYLLGRTQYQLDRPSEALRSFERCLQLQPRYLPARYNAGLALERLQREQDAEAAYREAIGLATQDQSPDPQPWLDLGDLMIAQQRFREAADVLAVAASMAPGNPMCQQQLGVALDGAGDHAAAVQAFQRATALAPNAERAHYYLARSLRHLGLKERAATEFAIVDRLHTSHEGTETPNPEVSSFPSKDGDKPK